jgi:hypothetical protein
VYFGSMTEASLIRDLAGLALRRRNKEVVEEASLGEKLGYSVLGTSERHFLAPLSTVSTGEPIQATVALQTKQIRILEWDHASALPSARARRRSDRNAGFAFGRASRIRLWQGQFPPDGGPIQTSTRRKHAGRRERTSSSGPGPRTNSHIKGSTIRRRGTFRPSQSSGRAISFGIPPLAQPRTNAPAARVWA